MGDNAIGRVEASRVKQLLNELDDYFLDLVSTYDELRELGCDEFRSKVGARHEARIRDFAERVSYALDRLSPDLESPGGVK